jgi:abortive infection bacteriophage resistance protein
MKFDKPPLTIEQQADLLLSRGLIADKEVLVNRLTVVNYYRLSTYLYPFRLPDQRYKNGTTLDLIWRRYTFDRQLRLLTMDAIERVEVSVRTKLAYHLSHSFGAFAYTNQLHLPGLSVDVHQKWINELKEELKRSQEPFIVHFNQKYGDTHSMPPLWMAIEVMSFGKTLTMFRGVDYKMKQKISAYYNVSDEILFSWLIALNSVRNICAHHGRLIDRVLGSQPKIPRGQKYPEWHMPVKITKERIFGILTILQYVLQFDAPTSHWKERLKNLFSLYPDVSVQLMGFPTNWEVSPLWKNN